MPVSPEMRRLEKKWQSKDGFPKYLDSIEIAGLRGWNGEPFKFGFPIMAVTGENGVGKSTVLQCAAAVYKDPVKPVKSLFASDFFPDTFWETISNARIGYSVRQGATSEKISDIRKLSERWRGNPERPERYVTYIDLRRVQPVGARVGYQKLVKEDHRETDSRAFESGKLHSYSEVMGRRYEMARMALTNVHAERTVPILGQHGVEYSGYHQGAGETTVMELLGPDTPDTALILIDEIETSLHPRVQRRLMRYLAGLCRLKDIQVVLTTHSPFILDELPPEARAYIMAEENSRKVIYGVSCEFAMSKMDDVTQYECDVYVEDTRSAIWLREILAAKGGADLVNRCQMIPFGSSSVGHALGQMVNEGRFPNPSVVFVDGDVSEKPGCIRLPGDASPEEVVFGDLSRLSPPWAKTDTRAARDYSKVADACGRAMLQSDPHLWIGYAANQLVLGGDILWTHLCVEWVANCLSDQEAERIITPIRDAVERIGAPIARRARTEEQTPASTQAPAVPAEPSRARPTRQRAKVDPSSGTGQLFPRSPDDAPR